MTESASSDSLGPIRRQDRRGGDKPESVVIPTETWLEVVRLARLGSQYEQNGRTVDSAKKPDSHGPAQPNPPEQPQQAQQQAEKLLEPSGEDLRLARIQAQIQALRGRKSWKS